MNEQRQQPIRVEFLGTPEAGKTTVLYRAAEELSKDSKTCIIRESAEITPTCFPKNSMDAHIWMQLNTLKEILKAQCSDFEKVLIDRGIIDTLFWNFFYYKTGRLSHTCMTAAEAYIQNIGVQFPDLVVYLYTTPEEAIRRRGGEGRTVTLDFVKIFKMYLDEFLAEFTKRFSVPIFYLDTTELSKDEVFEIVLKQIKS